MTAPVSRREALAVGISTATGLIGSSTAAPVPKGGDSKSWVGKTVLPKKPGPRGVLIPSSPDGDEAWIALDGASWEVKAETRTRIKVRENGHLCWIHKEDVVPAADAIEFYTTAIGADQKDAYAYNFRGWAKYLLGKPDEAVADFGEFLNQYPAGNDAAATHRRVGLSNRGLVLAEMGKFDAALKDLDEAVKLGYRAAQLNRGWAYELKSDYKSAVADYAAILELHPADAPALNNLAWLRATCPDAKFRDGKGAVDRAKWLCEWTGNSEGMFLDTLAAAHAEAGDFAAAVKRQELALEDQGYTRKYGADAQKRLQLYKDRKPYRSTPLKPE